MATFTSYAAWYDLPENDPYRGDYATLFPVFAVTHPGMTDIRLANSIACGTDSKAAFLFLDNTGTVHLLHRIRRFIPSLGSPVTAYDNSDFATFDEATPFGPSTVEVPLNFFTTARVFAVLTAAAIDQEIAAAPNRTQFTADPLTTAARTLAGEMTDLRCRKAMIVPPNLTGAILTHISSPVGLKARDFWFNFVAPLAADPAMTILYAPLIDWARIAYAGGENAGNPFAVGVPPLCHLEPPLGTDRYRLFLSDFPPIAVANNMDPLVAELALTRRDAAERDAQRRLLDQEAKAAAALPTKRWGAGLSRLLRLCHVDVETDLPRVWLDMAINGVKADITTIRAHLHTPQPDLGPSGTVTPPVCTIDMAKTLGRLEFQTQADAIDSGIHIFGVCHPTQASATKANAIAGIYAEQILGVTGLSVNESIELKKAQSLLLPASLLELKHVLLGYHRFLAVILGPQHPVVQAFGILPTRLQDDELTYHVYFQRPVSLCTSLLRFVQLRMYYWIDAQLKTDLPIPPPSFSSVLDDILNHCWNPPPMPPDYLALTTPAPRRSFAQVVGAPRATPPVIPDRKSVV